jgi:hypothetical protein
VVGGIYGAETCLVVAAIFFLIQALVILLSPVPSLAQQPAAAGSRDPTAAPEMA